MTDYLLRLRPLPHTDTDGVRALRGALKTLLRKHRLRALEINEIPDGKQEKANAPNHKASTSRTAETSRRRAQLSQPEHDHEWRRILR
jgi:hypothetical protein